jgi:polygalacturonase
VESNTTVWLAGGAYFTGTFDIADVENVSILGRGIARPADGYEGCHVHRSRNVLIDGLTLNTCPVGGSDSVTLHDVRSISHPGWGDGLNVFASSNVLFDRVFCRNSDDCTTAYATRKGFSGSTRNITMRNSTLWADVAHPIFIGIHGNAERGDTIELLRYENIDILGQAEPQVDYQGCLAINCGDNNYVKDVLFDNIRIENIHQGSIFQVKVGFNQKYCTAPGKGVENVTFRNIRYYGESPYMSVINGYDDNRKVRNIKFEGLKINGQAIFDDMPGKPKWYATADYVPAFIGNHVDSILFLP